MTKFNLRKKLDHNPSKYKHRLRVKARL